MQDISEKDYEIFRIRPENSKIHRNDKVLNSLIYIRLKENIDEAKALQTLSEGGLIVRKRLLPITSSIRYNQKLYDETLQSSSNADAIIKAEKKLLRTFVVSYDGNLEPEAECAELIKNKTIIEIAEPIYVQSLCGEFIPNDSLLNSQSMLKTINAYEAWSIYDGETAPPLVISDTGVLNAHEDLAGKVWINKKEIPDDGLDNDKNGVIDDYEGANFAWKIDGDKPSNVYNKKEGHGTGVAGIAAANTNNQKGIAGVGNKLKYFPIKTMPDSGGGILFGYESIIYAANCGFKVINCSWGSLTYSDVNKTIIEYALSKDLAIIAAAGNHGTSDPFYPAAYPGVLGVGVTDPRDKVIEMSAYGAHVDIMAPGQETMTTSNDGTYGSFCCTSGAAPIVAAQTALIRGLHPNLNAMQCMEIARLSVDNIEKVNNPSIRNLIPGRVNLLKSVTMDPLSSPAIRYIDYSIRAKGFNDKRRFSIDDTLLFHLKLKNYLAKTDSLTFKLSFAGDSLNSLKLIDSVLSASNITTYKEFEIGDFAFSIEKYNPETPFLRVDIEGVNYKDFFLIPFTPYLDYTTFKNSKIQLTACDNGRLAYSDPPNDSRGEGFKLINKPGCLFEGSFIVCEDSNKIVTQARKDKKKRVSDFASQKPYLEPNENQAIFADSFAPDSSRIGVEIENTISFPFDTSSCVQVFVKLINKSNRALNNISAAYFFDYDIGIDGSENTAVPYYKFIPSEYWASNSAAALISRDGDFAKVGMAITSNYPGAKAVFSSFKNEITNDENAFSREEQIKYLYALPGENVASKGDIATVIGMRFPGIIEKGDSVAFELSLCLDDSVTNLRNYIWRLFDSNISEVVERPNYSELKIYPNPCENYINICRNGIYKIQIVDILGSSIFEKIFNNKPVDNYVLDTEAIPAGSYLIKVFAEGAYEMKYFIKN
jgi:hypothetical protein